jgi:hypothetical protein
MGHESRTEVPVEIEQVVAGLAELGTLLGSAGGAVIPAVADELRHAMAARDRGDPVRTFEHIGLAMQLLVDATARLDSREATMMRAVLEQFRSALRSWDEAGAKRVADNMFERSGARWKRS